MNVELLFTGGDCTPGTVRGKNAVVIDVLRATSVIVAALENGAAAVVPFQTIEEATQYAASTNKRAILGGERNALKIDGFDCGNSPLEYTRERVADREVVLTTTNGTQAVENARRADCLLILCMRNVDAVAEKIASEDKNTVVVCSGTDGKFSADDALCAGIFLDRLCTRAGVGLDDAGRFARDFYRMSRTNGIATKELLKGCLHMERLRARGFEADLDYCLTVDAANIAPVYREGRIVA